MQLKHEDCRKKSQTQWWLDPRSIQSRHTSEKPQQLGSEKSQLEILCMLHASTMQPSCMFTVT